MFTCQYVSMRLLLGHCCDGARVSIRAGRHLAGVNSVPRAYNINRGLWRKSTARRAYQAAARPVPRQIESRRAREREGAHVDFPVRTVFLSVFFFSFSLCRSILPGRCRNWSTALGVFLFNSLTGQWAWASRAFHSRRRPPFI